MSDGALFRIVLPYACYSLRVIGNTVWRAPPIASWMRGRAWDGDVLVWLTQRGAKVERISGEL